MTEPFFHPWIGQHYAHSPQRLLVLGESHYGPADMAGDSTVLLTQQYIDQIWSHRFWTNIMQVVAGRPYWELQRADVWHHIAFYNYVQQPVAETAGVAPDGAMFAASAEAFFTVLDRLAPHAVLVLSRRLWDNLPPAGRAGASLPLDDGERETWLYPAAGGETLATWIPHPSYGFNWSRWHPLVKALRTAAGRLPQRQ